MLLIFCNPAPDADVHSVGQDNFDWIVENAAELAIAKAKKYKKGQMNLTWGTFVKDQMPKSNSRPSTAKKASAKKTAAKKVVTKKAPAKKVAVKKAATKKTTTRKAPAKKTVAKKVTTKKTAAKTKKK